ncbi:daptide-type RiPP [Saccharibacillus kuerlensis]|uniref:Class IIb bacteriocin, lactobin A/cerein 7B family n=1 Tax=Saccharibacillus kuerlensis TaxID=459527 RepID=A0ABQ2L2F9_9BACL|nr:daptide-type RiPP [Saccharibacillus kuerlensis]GGO00026.1 hypothetical protein GCM10010969_20780 [Saccharibacillus kuerlensis]GGO00035.1 hypothetical protein GCM10010969_20800 [Saccharibacillus kuerlensis]
MENMLNVQLEELEEVAAPGDGAFIGGVVVGALIGGGLIAFT